MSKIASSVSAPSVAAALPLSTRSGAAPYFAALFLATFFSAYFVYLGLVAVPAALAAFSWIVVPLLMLADRTTFDGRRLAKDGPLHSVLAALAGRRRTLKVVDVEHIESRVHRRLRRGLNVSYRYTTVVHGRGSRFVLSSGSGQYVEMLRAIAEKVSAESFDLLSRELVSHSVGRSDIERRAAELEIPRADVLEGSVKRQHRNTTARPGSPARVSLSETRIEDLHELGNQLRLNGRLLPAIEAFRRALLQMPHDPYLLFDFGRCLFSYADLRDDERIRHRAVAAFRLAERFASGEPRLLVDLGDAYLQAGEWQRSESVLKKIQEDSAGSFRAAVGLAELALGEGKVAHVIHHFAAGNRLTNNSALRRWARREYKYFSRLNDDAEYMELEIARVNLVETLERSMNTCQKIVSGGLAAILVGSVADNDVISSIGWSVSAVSLAFWAAAALARQMQKTRLPIEEN